MPSIDWDNVELERVTTALRERRGGPDAEKMIWAFERARDVARVDGELLSYVLVACVCLLSWADDVTPRDVLEAFFRRSVSDEEWRETYLPLFS